MPQITIQLEKRIKMKEVFDSLSEEIQPFGVIIAHTKEYLPTLSDLQILAIPL